MQKYIEQTNPDIVCGFVGSSTYKYPVIGETETTYICKDYKFYKPKKERDGVRVKPTEKMYFTNPCILRFEQPERIPPHAERYYAMWHDCTTDKPSEKRDVLVKKKNVNPLTCGCVHIKASRLGSLRKYNESYEWAYVHELEISR